MPAALIECSPVAVPLGYVLFVFLLAYGLPLIGLFLAFREMRRGREGP